MSTLFSGLSRPDLHRVHAVDHIPVKQQQIRYYIQDGPVQRAFTIFFFQQGEQLIAPYTTGLCTSGVPRPQRYLTSAKYTIFLQFCP